MNKVTCTQCGAEYEFNDRWFERNDPKIFVCRTCKIKNTTRSKKFRDEASERSKKALSDENVKARMSQIATLNNIKNAEKISESVKEHFSANPNRSSEISEMVKERWQDPEYRDKISKSSKKAWEDPEYRGKIIGSRFSIAKKNKKLQQQLKGIEYEEGFTIGPYTFTALILGIYLYDEEYSKEKQLFIEHNMPKLKYVNDLTEVKKSEN